MEIKDIIKKRREELGLTYEQLGNMVGVGKSTVRKWETGLISNMRRDNIVALSKALNISPALIMGWNDESENNKRELEYLKVENDLKNIILNKYSSIEAFSIENNLSYTKVDKIFKKGIAGTDIQLIFKICSILDIDVDSIADGEIHFNTPLLKYAKFPSTLTDEQSILLVNFDNLDNEDKNKVVDYTKLLSNQDKYKILNNVNDEITATKEEDNEDEFTRSRKEALEARRKAEQFFKEKPHLMPIASHDREGNFSEEDYIYDDDIMTNDDLWK